MDVETLRKKPACVLRRDAWLTELRQLEDRESLRPWLHKYGCFEKNKAWSSSGMVHLDNLKELAKRFRLHKSIPNFFRDYTTEDSLVAVLKRYVRNNAAFLSLAPSVARKETQRGPPGGGGGGGGGGGACSGGGGDALHTVGPTTSLDSTSILDSSGTTTSGGMHAIGRDDISSSVSLAEMTSSTAAGAGVGGGTYAGVLTSSDAIHLGTGGSTGQVSKGSVLASSNAPYTGHRGRRNSAGIPRRPLHPRRPTKGSILLNPNSGGRKLFGHSDADTTSGMIQMSRMGLSSYHLDRLHIIYRQNKGNPRNSPGGPGPRPTGNGPGHRMAGATGGMAGSSGAGGGGEDRPGGGPATPTAGGGRRKSIQSAPGGAATGSAARQRAAAGGLGMQRSNNEDGDGVGGTDEARGGGGWGDAGEGGSQRSGEGVGDDDYSQTLKLKAAQAMFRMSLEPGGEMKLVRDGVVVALSKLIGVENVQAHRLVSGCLANLTTTRDVTWELLQANGHQVLSFLVSGVKTPDPTTLANVATALCRCTYEARNHKRLVTEFNTAQALCYIMQRQTASLKITSAKGMLNMCGLSSTMPALSAKLDVYMLTLCSAMEDLARNEKEAVQTFVCRGIQALTSVPACLTRIPDSGIVDLLLPLVKLNQKRPGNLARLASAAVNLTGLQSAHAQLVKQKDIVAVLCLLAAHPRLVESCCVAAAGLSRTRDLEAHLAPLATTLVEVNLPNEASVDCIAYFLQNVSRAHNVNEPSVTGWLAAEADSASAEGRLACLSAIGHLIRRQEDTDMPLLQAGLMSTLHAILDEPSAPPPAEEPQESSLAFATVAGAPTNTAMQPRKTTHLLAKGGGPSSPLLTATGNTVGRGDGGGGVTGGGSGGGKKGFATTQQRRKNRENLAVPGADVLDRILAVVMKICFSLTRRAKNGPRLMQDGLPALCAKVLKLTNDANILFMAVACLFSLSQSPDLCSGLAKSGAADLALEALAGGRPGEESEFLLAQLAVVAQVAREVNFCRRLATPETVDLLMRLTQGTPGDGLGPNTREGIDEHGDGNDGVGQRGRRDGGSIGGSSGSKGGSVWSSLPKNSRSGAAVKVASPYLGALRYCVVSISERLGAMLDDDGLRRASTPSEVSSMVAKLVQIVCSVVLSSGPDEALMGRCALVMSDWSTSPRFAQEIAMKPAAGRSLAVLMRSVATTTRVRASMALCNVAAANHADMTMQQIMVCGQERDGSVRVKSGTEAKPSGEDASIGDGIHNDVGGWLRSTNILRDIVAAGRVRATGEVKGNLIKAINNLMCADETRRVLVADNQMASLFELIHGYNPEVRELAAGMLYNLTCEREFHPALLDAGITYTLLELLGPCQRPVGVSHATAPVRATNNSPTPPGNITTTGAGAGVAPNGSLPTGAQTSGENRPGEGGSTQDSSTAVNRRNPPSNAGSGGGGGVEAPLPTAGADAAGKGGGKTGFGGEPEEGRVFDKLSSGDGEGISVVDVDGGGAAGVSVVAGGGKGHKPSLRVRRNVLGAVMNLTTSSLSHPRLDPSAVMSLLTLIMQEDPSESCPNEDMAGDLWVAWQAVVLQLSFVEKYRPLIVYHGDGQVFQHIKLTNDPLSGKSSVMSPEHDRVYKRLIMGTVVNIACEPSLYEELEGQVQVLREFLSEYEHEASGGGCAASSGSGSGGGGGRTGSSGSHNGGGLSEGPGGDVDDGGMTADDGVGGGVAVGGGSGGGMGGGGGDNPSRGRDWVRHELCGKLVSNLFSNKSLRERLSKKPVAGILVGLLCGPPPRISRPPQSAQSNVSATASNGRPSRSRERATGGRKVATSSSVTNDGEAALAMARYRGPFPEGHGEPRPVLYGGGEEAAAIAARFLCKLSVLYAVEGGFELPQRTFEALVKIAHYYNYNVSVVDEVDSPGGEPLDSTASATSAAAAATAARIKSGTVIDASEAINGNDVGTGDFGDSRADTSPATSLSSQRNAPRASSVSSRLPGLDQEEGTVKSRQPSPLPSKPMDDSGAVGGGGDDWYMAGRPSTRISQSHLPGRGGGAWAATAIDLTRLWARAVGALCGPSHAELWPLMIDTGMLGALNTCLASTALLGDDEGLSLCSAALRNLSTATPPRSLRGERAAACFGSAKRLLSRCSDQPQVRIDCAAAMVNFVDASHVQDLQALDVVGLLGEQCSWDNTGEDTSSDKLVRELAVYSLSKLCTRDFVPTGDRVIATITTMMDFDPQTIQRLDDLVGSRVTPPLPPTGLWRYLEPHKDLGATALPVLRRRSHCERWPGDDSTGGADGRKTKVLGDDGWWELHVATGIQAEVEAPTLGSKLPSTERSRMPATRSGHAPPESSKGGGHGVPKESSMAGGGGVGGAAATSSVGSGVGGEVAGKVDREGTGTAVNSKAASSNVKSETSEKPPADGIGGGKMGAKHRLRAAATRLTNRMMETSMAASAFGSAADGPVKLESRILRHPVLTAEDPPFELQWLLNHGKADRLRLFQESMGGVPSASAWLSQTHSKPQTAATDPAKYQGQSPAAAANAFPRDQGVGTGGRERGDGAGASNAPNEDGFYVLTVPDGKWTSPDLPPEAGRRPSGVVDCPSPVIGGSRPTGVRGAYGQRNNTTGARSAASTPQRR